MSSVPGEVLEEVMIVKTGHATLKTLLGKVTGCINISGADFTKGLNPVSNSNLRLLSQIIGIFYLSPWAQP